MASSTFIVATASLAFLTTVGSTLMPPLSSKLSSPAWTSSWTSENPITASDGRASNESNTSSNLSEEERRRYMVELQEDTKRNMIPTMIYLATLGVIGLFGNSLVLSVYSKKARRSATDIFIMAIAASDLTANILAIPGEIYDSFHLWDAHSSPLCKCRVFLNAWTTLTSGHLLFAVAFCRYRKICRPHGKQISLTHAKIMSIIIALVSSLNSVPTAIVYGIQTTPTPRSDVFGHRCFTDDKYVHTIWPFLNSGFLMLLFFGFGIPLIVLYVRIGIQAWRHRTFISQNTPTIIYSEEEDNGKSKAFSFFGKKEKKKKEKKCCIVLVSSSNDEDVGSHKGAGNKDKPANIKEQKSRSKNEERAIDEEDGYCTRNLLPWATPMCKAMPDELNEIKGRGINKNQNDNADEEVEKLKPEILNEKALALGCSNTFTEGKKMEEQDEVTYDDTYRKSRSQSVQKSRQKIVRQKVDGTLTEARTAKEENVALNEMDSPTNVAMTTPDAVADAGNDQITFNLTIAEKTVDDQNRIELKSRDLSPCRSPVNVNLKSKNDKSKRSPQRTGLTRTTLMLIIISAIFFIGFLPYLLLMSCTYLVPNFRENMSGAGFAAYNVFLRFYFVNSAANAIIYSLCDIRFRNQVKTIMPSNIKASLSFSSMSAFGKCVQ